MDEMDDAKPERSLDGRKLALVGIAAAVLVAAALAGWFAWKGHKQKQDETAIVAAVTAGTPLLREALGGQSGAETVARLDAQVKSVKAAGRTPLADAAEDYLTGAREIARRRADAARLAPAAAASRQALLAHLGAGGRRGDGWFKHAGDLKKRMENAHFELNSALKTLDTLIEGMHGSRTRMLPLVGEKLIVDSAALNNARAGVQAELKRTAEELERARQVPIG